MEIKSHHLTLQKIIESRHYKYSKLIQENFIKSFLNLDVSIFEPYMNEYDVFDGKTKYIFLEDLEKTFQPYKSKKNVFSVKMRDEMCLGCKKGKNVLQFTIHFAADMTVVGDFGFIIDRENGILKDIYRCYQCKYCEPIQIKPEGLPAISVQGLSCK